MNTIWYQNCGNSDVNIHKSYFSSLQYSTMCVIHKSYFKSHIIWGQYNLKSEILVWAVWPIFIPTLGYKIMSHLFEYSIKWFWHPIQCIMRISYSSLESLSCDMFRNPMGEFPLSQCFSLLLMEKGPKRESSIQMSLCSEHQTQCPHWWFSWLRQKQEASRSRTILSCGCSMPQHAKAPNAWAIYWWCYCFHTCTYTQTASPSPKFPMVPGFLC